MLMRWLIFVSWITVSILNCEVEVQNWIGSTRGSISVGALGQVESNRSPNWEMNLAYKVGDLPHPVSVYGSWGISYHSRLILSTNLHLNSVDFPENSSYPFHLNWDYLGLSIPFHRSARLRGLRPSEWSLGVEWHFLDYSINPGAFPSLENVDASISSLILQPRWNFKIKNSSWSWFLKPRGVWMHDLGGAPATHLEGELGFYSGPFTMGYKRKKTRIFPKDRVERDGQVSSDMIFIRDGVFVKYTLRW